MWELAQVIVNSGEQGRVWMHETPCLCKRRIWIISIWESSEEQKNKTYSLDHRNLPQKKEGSDAVMKAKKKCCWIYIMGRDLHHRYHKAADAAVQKAQESLPSSTAVDDGTQQLQWRMRKSICHLTRIWRRLVRVWCCENCWSGISPIKQDWEGWTRSLLALPFKLHVKLCSAMSQSSTAIQPLPQRPLQKTGQPHRASLQQRLVSISLFGCQLLSAHAQALFCLPKNWANLFNISTDQGKKII